MALANVSQALDNDLSTVRAALDRLGGSADAVRAVASIADHPWVAAVAEAAAAALDPAAEPIIAGLISSITSVAKAFPAPAPAPAEEAPAEGEQAA